MQTAVLFKKLCMNFSIYIISMLHVVNSSAGPHGLLIKITISTLPHGHARVNLGTYMYRTLLNNLQ